MKILLINNNTKHLTDLTAALAGHDIEMQIYKPGLKFHHEGKDLIVLSGGNSEGLEIHDEIQKGKLWYEDQMNFILKNSKPVLGICMGFEVIANAYGGEVREMPKVLKRRVPIITTKKGHKIFKSSKLKQIESHQWQVTKVPHKQFEVLAHSKTGIEVIKHRKKPILATQFHPEVPGGTLRLNRLVSELLN